MEAAPAPRAEGRASVESRVKEDLELGADVEGHDEDLVDLALRELRRQGRVRFRLDEKGRKVYYLVLS